MRRKGPEGVPPPQERSVSHLKARLVEITDRLFEDLKEMRSLGEVTSEEEAINRHRDELIEKYGDLAKIEILTLKSDLAAWINILYQNKLLNKNEAEYLLAVLQDSRGYDNYATLALLHLLVELDLYLKERIIEEELSAKQD